MNRQPHRPHHPGPGDVVIVVVAGAGLAASAWVWATGQIAGRVALGRWPRVPVRDVGPILAALPHHLGDPRLAWPAPIRAGLPGPVVMYGWATGLLLPLLVVALMCRRAPRRRVPGGRAVRRPRSGGPTGARWATRSDTRPIRSLRPGRQGRLVLGRAGASGVGNRVLATETRHSVLVIGPTQSGKTSGLAIPALLEWAGPVIATSIKDDLAATTLGWRSRTGSCQIFDPTRTSGLEPLARWTPLGACDGWSDAQRVSACLVDATPARTGMADAAFWYAAAAKQLAPLLLAARRAGMSMAEVVAWTNAGDFEEALGLLELAGETDAALALSACAGRDERIRSSVTTTLETVLSPFEDPIVSASTAACDVDLSVMLDTGGSLYLCGPSHEQNRVQGLFATIVSAAIGEVVRRVNSSGRPLDPPLLLVLDEAANIAPVRDLDTLASTGAGLGIQLVTVCQDLSQLSARYGSERARTIANNHRAKVLLSGVSDLSTLDMISGLAGEQAVREETVTHDLHDGRRTSSQATVFRRLAPTDELRRIPPGDGVLVYGHLPPVRLRLRPWYRDRRLRRRAGAGAPPNHIKSN